MADIKISQLPAASTPLAGTEEIPLVQSGTTKKATVSQIIAGATGGVTAVTGTAPVVSSGGTTPAISMAAATGSVNGYLTSTDWNTFNNKQPAGSYLTSGGALGTPSSGTATNLTGLPLSTGVTGTLPVANGGTGTATPSLVAGTNVTVTGTWPNQTINSTASGTGDVVGPASSTDNAVARFDSTTGKIIQNSGVVINDSGEVTVGVWKGTEVGLSYGGTGASSASQARGNILPSYTGNAGKVLAVNSGETDVEYISAGGTGTVTSVAVSGGTTGLTTSGGPITAAGTITLGGTLAVASGGTGTATPSLVAGTNVTITGTWPNQTINSSGGGSMTYPGAGIANSTGSAWGTSYSTTGSGTVVALATSPTFVTPVLGTPTSGDFSTGTFTWPTFNQNTTGTAAGLSTTLVVGSGGTGATTLTGYVKGSGTSALTASSTIPSTDITGLGTMSTQDASSVAITGGTINGATIGGTTPAAVTATTLVVNDNTTLGSSNTDTATFTARIASEFTPATSNTYDLGRNSHEWRNLYLAGTGNIGSLVATTADINGGTIDATAIGGTTPAAGAFTTVTATSAIGVASGGTGQTSYTDGQLLIGNSTGNTLSKATLTAGSNITITNGNGSITIAASGGGGASAATPTSLGTVYGKTDTGSITFLGYQAGNASSSAAHNVAVGASAMAAITTGTRNIVLGSYAAGALTTGEGNIVLGTFGVGTGTNTFASNTSGSDNIAIGGQALTANTTASYNIAIGAKALTANTTGTPNLAIGLSSLQANTTGAGNVALGENTLRTNTTASGNTAVGCRAAYSNATGTGIVALGYQALYTNTGDFNIAVGPNALVANTSGSSNVAIGSSAGPGYNYVLKANTTGANNTAVGASSMENNTTGSLNTAYGSQALWSNTTASNNTAVGYQAGYANTTGSITAVGYASLDANTTGYSNAALGADALGVNTTGYENTALGAGAGASVVTGARNVYVGFKAGSHDSGTHTGVQSIFIGAYARPNAAGDQAEIVLGYDLIGKGTDTTFIRNACYQGNNSSSWSTTSDQRLKKNIADNNDGLDKINSIRVRNFEYRLPDEITELDSKNAIGKEGVQLGVIAQELQAVLPECVKQESSGVLSVDTDNLTWYLINAVKQLKAEFDAYKASHP